jgi:hypothetical protein
MFSTLAGSSIGNYHKSRGLNSQDAFAVEQNNHTTALVLADGCGSGRHSEVGAKLAATMLAQQLAQGCPLAAALAATSAMLTDVIRYICPDGGQYANTVLHYGLFTLVGAVLSPDQAYAFAIGDGIIAWQADQKTEIKALIAANNAPDYLGYALLGQAYTVWRHDWTSAPDKLLLASDGLPAATTESAVALLWHDDMWQNPHQLQRYLNLEGRERHKLVAGQLLRQPGRWRDDITVLLARPTQPAG